MDGLPCSQIHGMMKCQPCPRNTCPAIHGLLADAPQENVDGRNKGGHDGEKGEPMSSELAVIGLRLFVGAEK
jgi:hypothetical protein